MKPSVQSERKNNKSKVGMRNQGRQLLLAGQLPQSVRPPNPLLAGSLPSGGPPGPRQKGGANRVSVTQWIAGSWVQPIDKP